MPIDSKNCQGLNEILSELLEHEVSGDWDKDLSFEVFEIKKDKVLSGLQGRVGQLWGEKMEKTACDYIKTHLEDFGWVVKPNAKRNGIQYDLFAWKGKEKSSPDLHIEFYFPLPQDPPHNLDKDDKVNKDRDKLLAIGAKHKYFVMGIPTNRSITTTISNFGDVQVKLQEHRVGKIVNELRYSRPDNMPLARFRMVVDFIEEIIIHDVMEHIKKLGAEKGISTKELYAVMETNSRLKLKFGKDETRPTGD